MAGDAVGRDPLRPLRESAAVNLHSMRYWILWENVTLTSLWAQLPIGRVVAVTGASPAALDVALTPLPADAPAVLTYRPAARQSRVGVVEAVLAELEAVAIDLFPAWLPEAWGIDGPGGSAVAAVRSLALRLGSTSEHFGPFLADLAEAALRTTSRATHPAPTGRTGLTATTANPNRCRSTSLGSGLAARTAGTRGAANGGTGWPGSGSPDAGSRRPGSPGATHRYKPEVRVTGLLRVIAASYGRDAVGLLVRVPAGLSEADEQSLISGLTWLTQRGRLGVWLTGAPLRPDGRVDVVAVAPPAELAELDRTSTGSADDLVDLPTVSHPPVPGSPHPQSRAEKLLETALAGQPWAAGRVWNQSYRPDELANLIRLDLLWQRHRCVVEIDGPEHRQPVHYEADRSRDVQLQINGYAVLRFTNDQVFADVHLVARQIQRFLTSRSSTPGGVVPWQPVPAPLATPADLVPTDPTAASTVLEGHSHAGQG